jgi:hypothetical protein
MASAALMPAAGVTAVTVAAATQPGQHPHRAQQATVRPQACQARRGYRNAATMTRNIRFRAAGSC